MDLQHLLLTAADNDLHKSDKRHLAALDRYNRIVSECF
jgi:hypothetical protein